MATITFLGAGLLGSAFAEAAARRGDAVTAWNRSPDKLLPLSQFGVKAAATPAAAVQGAERVHLILKDDAVVDADITAARPGLSADAVVIDHSTTQPQLTAERAARLEAEGVRYLHCPVFMGPSAARNAQGTMLVSGPEAIFNSVKAELIRMTGRLDYLGERPDLAALHKLFGNAMFIGLWAVMADILTLAKAGGVAPEDAIKLLGTLDLNAVVAARGTSMAACNFKPTFELAMARKDVQLMLETVETAGDLPLAALGSVAARMDQLIASGYGAEDAGVLAIDAVRQS